MRVLILLRGAPCSGKSTWVEDHNLSLFTLSLDNFKIMCSSLDQCVAENLYTLPQDENYFVWKKLYEFLEYRMSRGEFTVVDSCCTRTSDMAKFKEIASKYRYKVYVVDFTDVSIDVVKKRNKQRSGYKWVPDEVIDKMYGSFVLNDVPSGIQVIKPNEFDSCLYKVRNYNSYNKIHHIGDIHGCYTKLNTYFKINGGIKNDELYIFTGDYLDRGPENVEMMRFLLRNYQRPNMIFLEGNHEKWLWKWAHDNTDLSIEFSTKTKPQLDNEKISKHDTIKFCRRLNECVRYRYHGREVMVTHGGIVDASINPIYISADQLIHGVGIYKDVSIVEQKFAEQNPNMIQIHGHRNHYKESICANERNYNLEGGVEYGGDLRVIQLTPNIIQCVSIKNTK